MFALQEHRSIAGVVSIMVHAGVLAAALAGAEHAASRPPEAVIIPESLLIAPAGPPSGPVGGPTAPMIRPIDIPVPGPLDLPGVPGSPMVPPTPGPSGAGPTVWGGADSAIFHPTLTDEPPMLLSAPVPAYPPLLRQAGIQGWVTVLAVVDTMGRAETASLRVVNSPNPGFDRPALDCLRRALFRPGRVHGRAVRVLVSVPLHFTLRP